MFSADQGKFDNQFVANLPGDPEKKNFVRQVTGACWSEAKPTPVSNPKTLAVSAEVAQLLEIPIEETKSQEFAEVFAGNELKSGMFPFAACYGGHQFGNWAGQLGDGRAISIGEFVNSRGERWELQLKGAGMTPYSRGADGRAVLRSSLREFLCSEAMFHLGVPTTRALSLVTTGDKVVRDMFYDGRPEREQGAIVCRVSPSFIRFGNFEILAAREDHALLAKLVDFTIARDFPHLSGSDDIKRLEWFKTVCARTAQLMVHWMRVGFVHGVMNTDNMSILGLTIDYGPYGWVDNYDPNWTPNTTDSERRRYAFGRQPEIALWNLACLASAIAPLFSNVENLRGCLDHYKAVYETNYSAMLTHKFGFVVQGEKAETIVKRAFEWMYESEVDMTIFFRQLAKIDLSNPDLDPLRDAFYQDSLFARYETKWQDWLNQYAAIAKEQTRPPEVRITEMNAANPCYVLRNYMAQEAIDIAESGDSSRIYELLNLLKDPYNEIAEAQKFFAKRPEWAMHRAGCSRLSCSS